jgi:hypothetical protein
MGKNACAEVPYGHAQYRFTVLLHNMVLGDPCNELAGQVDTAIARELLAPSALSIIE